MFDLANVQELLVAYGYWIILAWTFFEGETIVVIAGILSSKGILKPEFIALAAFGGSFCSDQLMFFLGRHFGPAIFKRFPRLEKNTGKVRRLMHKYETLLILGFRFVYGVRNITPIMLGMSGVSHLKFLFLNIIGGAIWAISFTYGGYYIGEAFSHAMQDLSHGVAYAVGAILVVVALIWWINRKREHENIIQAENVAVHQDSWKIHDENSAADSHCVNAELNSSSKDKLDGNFERGSEHSLNNVSNKTEHDPDKI